MVEKSKNIETNSEPKRGVSIDQSAMCYISMDSSWQALQTNGNFFSNLVFVFELLTENPKIFNK